MSYPSQFPSYQQVGDILQKAAGDFANSVVGTSNAIAITSTQTYYFVVNSGYTLPKSTEILGKVIAEIPIFQIRATSLVENGNGLVNNPQFAKFMGDISSISSMSAQVSGVNQDVKTVRNLAIQLQNKLAEPAMTPLDADRINREAQELMREIMANVDSITVQSDSISNSVNSVSGTLTILKPSFDTMMQNSKDVGESFVKLQTLYAELADMLQNSIKPPK